MLVTFISQCEKKALLRTRRILDAFANRIGDNVWQTLTKPAKRVKVGTVISFGDGSLKMRCIREEDTGIRDFSLIYDGILL